MQSESRRLSLSILIPIVFISILWLVKLIEFLIEHRLVELAVRPRELGGLVGIITSPFVHGDFQHLTSNSAPLLVLGIATLYFYHKVAWKVVLIIFLLDGVGVWIIGREGPHLGASGLVYGLFFFLFFAGVFGRDKRLLAISLLVTFLYGGMVWGLLPVDTKISWEAHLFGAVSGVFCAFFFRKQAPKPKEPKWGKPLEEVAPKVHDNWGQKLRVKPKSDDFDND